MARQKIITIQENAPRRVGVVTSDVRDRTRKIVIQFSAKHPKYGKYMRRRTIIHAHDEENISGQGDMVEIAECRPISKTKRWAVMKVLKEASAS